MKKLSFVLAILFVVSFSSCEKAEVKKPGTTGNNPLYKTAYIEIENKMKVLFAYTPLNKHMGNPLYRQ